LTAIMHAVRKIRISSGAKLLPMLIPNILRLFR
jgi:hypothetical protein